MLRLLSVFVLLVIGCLAQTAGSVSASDTQVKVHEECSFKLLSGDAVALTTSFTFTNARRGRSTSVSVVPGWNVGRMYPKAEAALFVRLGPGQSARRVVTRTIPSVPRLWEKLSAGRVNCASTFTYKIP